MNIHKVKSNKSFKGHTSYYEHESFYTKTKMRFSTFEPESKKIDTAIVWLSGLTCTEENFITKAGVQKYLVDTNTMIICPDTSPRGTDLPGEHVSDKFGSGAGFYVNANTDGYKDHYNMYDYVTKEIVAILKEFFNVKNISIMGHSMGGHGALVMGLRESSTFKAVSAFAPIVNPSKVEWCSKAFEGYLGKDKIGSEGYDATKLVQSGKKAASEIFIDQGLEDEFLKESLLTENFVKACSEMGQDLKVKYREGYNHSYFYISTFIEEHIEFHLEHLYKTF